MFSELKRDLQKVKNPAKAAFLKGYFKTDMGDYGEGDILWGITVPQQRKLAKKYRQLALPDIQQLLASKIHEFRFTALLILDEQYHKADTAGQEKIVTFYLKNLDRVNNWDLVDTSAPCILGEYLLDKDRALLYKLADSPNVWRRRVAILSTYAFVKHDQFADTFKLAQRLLNDKHDLIYKAVGWMLREVGNRDQRAEMKFLDKHYQTMPRTMLRYAIEKFDPATRQRYLTKVKKF